MTFATVLGGTLSTLTLFGQILALILIVTLVFVKRDTVFMRWVRTYGMLFGAIIALIAMLGSLSYSDILGYEPCKLCWYQRILMYPQVLILGVGYYLKDRNASAYALVLSMIGAGVSWYHYLMQLGYVPASCGVVGYSVLCAKVFTMQYGYITIPLMACTAFVLNTVFLLIYRNATK